MQDIIYLVVAMAISIVAGAGLHHYTVFKHKVKQIKKFFDYVDRSLADDKITVEEARHIIALFKEIFS
jgi:hypothetical protein